MKAAHLCSPISKNLTSSAVYGHWMLSRGFTLSVGFYGRMVRGRGRDKGFLLSVCLDGDDDNAFFDIIIILQPNTAK